LVKVVNGKSFNNYAEEIARKTTNQGNKKTIKKVSVKMSEKAKEEICKKETGQLASPKLPKTTSDAEIHKQELIDAREARNVDYVEIDNPANTARKGNSDTGNFAKQDVSGEYAVKEANAMVGKKVKQSDNVAPTPVINEDY
jgi:hypothetical protein